jgi:hypothetical protein
MKDMTAAMILVELLKKIELKPYSYSGRGMFGKRCVGVTLNEGENEVSLGAELANALNTWIVDGEGCEMYERAAQHLSDLERFRDQQLSSILRSTRGDQMGLSSMVYWPSISWVEEEEEEAASSDD